MDRNQLMRVVQLPIFDEQFQSLKEEIDQQVSDALAMACTDETVKDVKKVRANLNKQFQELEERRKQIKKSVMEPYNAFDGKYKEYISDSFARADAELKKRIENVEGKLKQKCEDELREYFEELCVANHLDWLQYEQLDIKIDMEAAKSKNRTRLRKDLKEYVESVVKDIELISGMDHELEILIGYKESLDFANSVYTVRKWHERIEEIKKEQELRNQDIQKEQEAIQRVETLAPPTVVEDKMTVSFKVTDTKERLIALRKWLDANGYEYE